MHVIRSFILSDHLGQAAEDLTRLVGLSTSSSQRLMLLQDHKASIALSRLARVRLLDLLFSLWAKCSFFLQLGLDLALNLDNRSSVRQHCLSALYAHSESDLLKSAIVLIAGPPHLDNQLVGRLDRRCKTGLELLHVLRLACTKSLQDGMCGGVPAKKAMDDRTAEAHLLARLRVSVQRVVITVQTVKMRGLHGGLDSASCVGRAVGRRVARNFGA